MLKAIKTYLTERELLEALAPSAEEKPGLFPRINALSRLQRLNHWSLTETSFLDLGHRPVRLFTSPFPFCFSNNAEATTLILFLYGDGEIRFARWEILSEEQGETVLKFLENNRSTNKPQGLPWPKERDFSPPGSTGLEQVFVSWEEDSRRGVRAFICYGQGRGEEVTPSREVRGHIIPSSRAQTHLEEMDYPPGYLDGSQQNLPCEYRDLNGGWWLAVSKNNATGAPVMRLWNQVTKISYPSFSLPIVLDFNPSSVVVTLNDYSKPDCLWAVSSQFNLMCSKITKEIEGAFESCDFWPDFQPTAIGFAETVVDEGGVAPETIVLVATQNLFFYVINAVISVDGGDKFFIDTYHLPETIKYILKHPDNDSHFLLQEVGGYLRSVRVRSQKWFDAKLQNILVEEEIKQWSWGDTQPFFKALSLDKHGSIYPDPDLVLKCLWDRVIQYPSMASSRTESPLETWEALLSWTKELAPKEPVIHALLTRFLANRLTDYRRSIPEKLPNDVTKVVVKTLDYLWQQGGEATLAVLWQRGRQLEDQYRINMPSPWPDPFPPRKLDLDRILQLGDYQRFVRTRVVAVFPEPVLDLISLQEQERIAIRTKNHLHILYLDLDLDRWVLAKNAALDLTEIFNSRTKIIQKLAGEQWVADVWGTGFCVFKWDGINQPREIESCEKWKDFSLVNSTSMYDNDSETLYLAGTNHDGRASIIYEKFPDRKPRIWQSETHGRISCLCMTGSYVYALDSIGNRIFRSGRYYGGVGNFTLWLSLKSTPTIMTVFPDSKHSNTMSSKGRWTVVVGDNRGRLFGFEENVTSVSLLSVPVMSWSYVFPSSISVLAVIYGKSEPSIQKKESQNSSIHLVVGSDQNGVFIIDPIQGILHSSLNNICPPRGLVFANGGGFFVGTTRGVVWLTHFQFDTQLKANLNLLSKQDFNIRRFIDSQYDAGLHLKHFAEKASWYDLKQRLPDIVAYFSKGLRYNPDIHPGISPYFLQREIISPARYFLIEIIVSGMFRSTDYFFPDGGSDGQKGLPIELKQWILMWLACSKGELQAYGAYIVLERLKSDHDNNIPIPPFLDEVLALWLNTLLKVLQHERSFSHKGQWSPVLPPLIQAILIVGVVRAGHHCKQALFDWLQKEEYHRESEFPGNEAFTLLFQGLLQLSPANLDMIQRFGYCLDRFFSITQGRLEVMERWWSRFMDPDNLKKSEGFALFWPQVMWDLAALLLLSKEGFKEQKVEQLVGWLEVFKKTFDRDRSMKAWISILDVFGTLLKAFKNRSRWQGVENIGRVLGNKACQGLISNPFQVWLIRLGDETYNFFGLEDDCTTFHPRKIILEQIREILAQDVYLPSLLEGRFHEAIRDYLLLQLDEIEGSWRTQLPQIALNKPQLLVNLSIKKEYMIEGMVHLDLVITNRWLWHLTVTLKTQKDDKGITLSLPENKTEEVNFKVPQMLIKEDKIPLHLHLVCQYHSEKWVVEVPYSLAMVLDLKGWTVDSNLSPAVSEYLIQSVGEKGHLVLQTIDFSLPKWRIQRLMEILQKKYDYDMQNITLLEPGKVLDETVLAMLPKGVRWIPLDFPGEQSRWKTHIRLCLHGKHPPRFSPLAACLVTLRLNEKMLPVTELGKLVKKNIREKAILFWHSMPLFIRRFLTSIDLLETDFPWLFGAETDLKVGHLMEVGTWSEWIGETDPPELSNLGKPEFERIVDDLKEYWDFGNPLPPKNRIATIFQRKLKFMTTPSAGVMNRMPGVARWSGKINLAKRLWDHAVLIVVEPTYDVTGVAFQSFIATIRGEEGALILLVGSDWPWVERDQKPEWLEDVVILGPRELFFILTWPNPRRALAWRMSQQLSPYKVLSFFSHHGLRGRVEMFHGRKDELEMLKALITVGAGALLMGARRIGKTSILEKLEHDFEMEGRVVCRMDFQAARSEKVLSAVEFFSKKLKEKLKEKLKRFLYKNALPNGEIPALTAWERWYELLPPRDRPILFLDEAEWLFQLDMKITSSDQSRKAAYFGRQSEFPLFSWFRQMNGSSWQSGGAKFPLIMVSFLHGSTNTFTLDNYIRISGAPLYNMIAPVRLRMWTDAESSSFLSEALVAFGVYLPLEHLELMAKYSLNLPWVLQSMGEKLTHFLAGEIGNLRLPTRTEILEMIQDVLHEIYSSLKISLDNAVEETLKEKRKSGLKDETVQKLAERLLNFQDVFVEFAKQKDLFPYHDPGKFFSLDDFQAFMDLKLESNIGIRDLEHIFSNLNRSVVLIGGGLNEYGFAYGLFPSILYRMEGLKNE